MKYLIAFLTSLALLAALPVYAQEDMKGCVTEEKFVEQNKPDTKIEWFKTLAPNQVGPVRDALGVPEDVRVDGIKLFSAYTKRNPQGEAGIAFMRAGQVCVYATLTPAAVMLVQHILEVVKSEEI